MFTVDNVLKEYDTLTLSFRNKDLVLEKRNELINKINSDFFAFEVLLKYGTFNDCEIINFKSLDELLLFKSKVKDETEDDKWCSVLFFSDNSKLSRYLDL